MIGHIELRERGTVPRGMRKKLNAFLKEAWHEAGVFFHEELSPKRFTKEHAREARYMKRKGENLPHGSKRWKRSYYGKKYLSKFGGGRNRADPLVYTGETRQAMKRASISATAKGVRVRYPGGRGLNRKHPRSRIRMYLEFIRVLPRETELIADGIDATLDTKIKADNSVQVKTVTF